MNYVSHAVAISISKQLKTESAQRKLREEIWPFNDLWGDEVRDFLKDEWMAKVDTTNTLKVTRAGVEREAEEILKVF